MKQNRGTRVLGRGPANNKEHGDNDGRLTSENSRTEGARTEDRPSKEQRVWSRVEGRMSNVECQQTTGSTEIMTEV
jgi:hypothetical protein